MDEQLHNFWSYSKGKVSTWRSLPTAHLVKKVPKTSGSKHPAIGDGSILNSYVIAHRCTIRNISNTWCWLEKHAETHATAYALISYRSNIMQMAIRMINLYILVQLSHSVIYHNYTYVHVWNACIYYWNESQNLQKWSTQTLELMQ